MGEDGEPNWNKSWLTSKEFNIENWMEANLRTLFDDEIVLDYEDKVDAEIMKSILEEEGYNYYEWDSGSRGVHINIYVDGLEKLDERTRLKYRELFIEKYNADPSKKTGWLALEWRPHFKTGRIKTLKSKRTTETKLDMNMLMKAKKLISDETREFKTSGFGDIDILKLAKKYGFIESGRSGDEVFGYFESSSRKKHIWINVKKQVFFDFHRWEGGGSYQLYKLLKMGK